MRIIKFRAWYAGEMEQDYISTENNYFDWGATNQNAYELHRDINLMQFTGLLDKNGEEIYEGDIVKTHFDKTDQYNTYDELGEVIWERTRFTIFNKKHGNNYRFSSDSEVIGNIYENPELLKSTQ